MRLDHLRSIDLNLLVVLAALLEERHATRAARRLGLTQSAVSRALQRLRDQLGDPLFVRAPGGLAATARAEELAPALRRLLEDAEVLVQPATFDPLTARREFSIGMADLAEPWLVPRLAAAVAQEAPLVDLASSSDSRPLEEGLEAGRFDLVVNPTVSTQTLRRQALLSEDFVCLLRQGHPALDKPWTAARYAALGHVLVAPRGTPGGVVDRALGDRGLARRVAVRVGSFGAAPEVVAATDLVTTLPRSIALDATTRLDLVVKDPPLPVPGFTLYAIWRERHHADPGHAWLRQRIAAIAAAEAKARKRAR